MRLKLRLYARDLDLIALKHIEGFKFTNALRAALVSYVETGECERIYPPPRNTEEKIDLRAAEQINISLNEEKHAAVIEWLLSLRPGMRSTAIKTVFRSAIACPELSYFRSDSSIILEREESGAATAHIAKQTAETSTKTDQPADDTPKPSAADKAPGKTMDETELDLFEDFFEQY